MKNKVMLTVLIAGGALILSLALFSNLFASDPLTPSETITSYYQHAKEGNIKGAKKLVAEDVITQYENGGTWYASSLDSAIIKEGKEYSTIEPINETIEGNTATVEVAVTEANDRKDTDMYYLIKQDGSWKITFR